MFPTLRPPAKSIALPHAARVAVPGAVSLETLVFLLGDRRFPVETPGAYQVTPRRVRSGAPLIHEGLPTQTVYIVATGAFKLFRTDEEGYEQTLMFVGPGELLGFDGTCRDFHPTSATALQESTVYGFAVADLAPMRRQWAGFDACVANALAQQITRLCDVVHMMAAVAAEVRLARFLIQLSERMARSGESPVSLYLRMCRRDLASHMGIAHETVSRAFTLLVGMGYLRVDNREVQILNLTSLRQFSLATRCVPAPLRQGRLAQQLPADPVGRSAAPIGATASMA